MRLFWCMEKVMQRINGTDYLRKIEYVFYHEALILEEVYHKKNKAAISEVRNDSRLSDPTAMAAIRNLTPVQSVVIDNVKLLNPEQWLEVIGKTRSYCRRNGEIYFEVMHGRYSREDFKKTCARLGISSDGYYRTLEKIRNYAALQAAWFHLIEID